MSATVFVNVLKEFLGNISEAFPENEGVKEGLNWLNILPEQTYPQIMNAWAKLTCAALDDIKERRAPEVAQLFDESSNPILSKINAKQIFASSDPQNLESFWQFLSTLTALSTGQQPSVPPPSPPPAVPVVQPQVVPPVPVVQPQVIPPAQPPPVQRQPADVVKGITAAIPEIFKSLNEALKNKGDDNPLGQILNQMLNPNALQTGISNNLGANIFDNASPNVMSEVSAQTGLQTEEILQKLRRLEMYERARSKKKRS